MMVRSKLAKTCRAYAGSNFVYVYTRPSAESTQRLNAILDAAGITRIDAHFLDFRDPWGNRIEIVGYDNIQFTKAPNVLRGMGLVHLAKNEKAKKELAEKGMALE